MGRKKVVMNGGKVVMGRKKVVMNGGKVVMGRKKVVTGRRKVVMIPLGHRNYGTLVVIVVCFFYSTLTDLKT